MSSRASLAESREKAAATYALWESGLTYGQIAIQENLTRNQVAGYCWRYRHRHGIAASCSQARQMVAKKVGAKRKMARKSKGFVLPGGAKQRPQPQKPPRRYEPLAVPEGAKIILDLGYAECRAPVGAYSGADSLFCGAKVSARDADGLPPSYCDDHAAVFYDRTTKRRRV